jgi:hypothetical protein
MRRTHLWWWKSTTAMIGVKGSMVAVCSREGYCEEAGTRLRRSAMEVVDLE